MKPPRISEVVAVCEMYKLYSYAQSGYLKKKMNLMKNATAFIFMSENSESFLVTNMKKLLKNIFSILRYMKLAAEQLP